MCTVGNVIKGIASVVSSVVPAVNSYNEQKDAIKYRTELALNNAKQSKKEANLQKQLGIEEARKRKLQGLRQASELMNQNASYGFELDSGNNLYNYNDVVDSSFSDAEGIQNTYNLRADNYFEDAKTYLKQAKQYQKQLKGSGWGYALTALGNTKSVAGKWFS